jgi:hypothetical protein
VDLGNLGTAIRPVFYNPPSQIGTPFGINVFSPYSFYPDDVKYFDTKSPYSNLYYVQGGLFQQLLKVSFSRNINPRWNAGFDYQRFSSSKLFNYTRRGEERVADHHAFLFYTRYKSKDSTYQVLAHFSHLNHTSTDQGGILPEVSAPQGNLDAFYNNLSAGSQLEQARSIDFRYNFHVFQQYAFAKGFQLFHIFDSFNQRYSYRDENPMDTIQTLDGDGNLIDLIPGQGFSFYPNANDISATNYNSLLTKESTKYELVENKLGLKGTFGGWDYRLHVRRRDWITRYAVEGLSNIPQPRNSEHFVGLWTQYRFSNNARLYAEGEYMALKSGYRVGGDYKVSGIYENKWFRGGYYGINYSPSLIQQYTNSNHFYWDNTDIFKSTNTNKFFGELNFQIGNLTLNPYGSFTNINNYVYFTINEEKKFFTPEQRPFSSPVLIGTIGGKFSFNWKNFYTNNEILYTPRLEDEKKAAIQIPEWFINSQLYYQNALFKKALYIQLGIDVHYKSAYYADAYMPAIGQFYVQHSFKVMDYPIIDVFLNARIRRVRVFIKMSNVNQGIVSAGYFASPYFPGQGRALGFGVNWPLFD